jgi:glycosyltransferase involved in cell wall biosynthesis
MRIGLISPPWLAVPPTGYGGTERVIDTLARALLEIGHDVVLLTTGDSTCPVPRRVTLPHSVGTEQASPALELRHVIAAYEQARAADVAVVHDHTLVGPFFARRFPWLPVVTTNHGPFQGDLVDVYRSMAELTPVIAISHNQAVEAKRLGIPVEAVIHHGVHPADYPVGTGRGGYAAFVGRMSSTKGVDVACRLAREAGIPLRIAAKQREPGEHEYFESCVRPLLGGSIEFLGELSRGDTLTLMGHAVCLLNPIAWPEPFGLVMLESLATGTPVVGTPAGAAPEIVDDGTTGFLRTGRRELLDALRRVEELDRRSCRAAVEARFTATGMARRHIQTFDDVVTRWPARRAIGLTARRPAGGAVDGPATTERETLAAAS